MPRIPRTLHMDTEQTFRTAVLEALVDNAAPYFEEAAHFAHTHGLQAHTQLRNGKQLDLRLTLKLADNDTPFIYRIGALPAGQRVVHEKTYGEEVQRLEGTLESINQTLVETELAAFFVKAAALQLDYVSQRHQPDYF